MTTDTTATDRATRFRQLHETGVLVLPNAWDAASARLIEDAGAQAIATTSAGVAWSLGHADGNHLPRELAADAVRRIVGVVSVPVTADIETGYGETPAELRSTIEAIIAAGAVGINIEDAGVPLRETGEQAGRIRTVREAADATGVPLFVNARIDTYLRQVGDPAGRLDETVSRARAYINAGADGIFVPGLLDVETLRELAGLLPVPLNVMAGPGAPAVAELAALGVRRVSVGTAIAQAAYATARRGARELLDGGTYDSLALGGVDYGELNALLS
ncbi:isocitrate lyase/phosphoenolpyruvate mutase family protein [Pseudonocardia yunnanensis]|uniref:Isocitrate lyase/phosphoenolpyruvate mutase family protein n=1 Tax=Pseudonocardia yunnanensis TaxID=58107 RepID=A0ABW4ENQ5_9PSEU